jgi:hypothetical protein
MRRMNFPSGIWPIESIPPYRAINTSDPSDVTLGQGRVPADTSITPEKLVQVNAYLDGFSFKDGVLSRGGRVFGSLEELADDSFVDLSAKGGFGYQVNGIGIVSLATQRVNSQRFVGPPGGGVGIPFVEPFIVTDTRNKTLRVLNALMVSSRSSGVSIYERPLRETRLRTCSTILSELPTSVHRRGKNGGGLPAWWP